MKQNFDNTAGEFASTMIVALFYQRRSFRFDELISDRGHIASENFHAPSPTDLDMLDFKLQASWNLLNTLALSTFFILVV